MKIEEYLVDIGFCSAKKAERLFADGRISSNRGIYRSSDEHDGGPVFVDGEPVQETDDSSYIVFNKPENRSMGKTVGESEELKPFIEADENARFLYQLDERTSGLTLITDNEKLRLNPAAEREYRVKVKRPLVNSFFRDLKRPIMHDGQEFYINPRKDKNRQLFLTFDGDDSLIYDRFGELQNPVFELKCVRFGDIKLNELGSGNMRMMTKKERRFLS